MSRFLALIPTLAALSALAHAQDFNGDGYADLAIGVPYEDVNGVLDGGAVNVLYGSATGLGSAYNQFLSQNSDGVFDAAEKEDHFGFAMTYGDFDADGYDDLAVGVPDEGKADLIRTGIVQVFYGCAFGLGLPKQQILSLDDPMLGGPAKGGELFGHSLCAGDFDGDGCDDLAVCAPTHTVNGVGAAGQVSVIYGSAAAHGLNTRTAQTWNQANCGGGEFPENGDCFGWSLAAGCFHGPDRTGFRCDDLAIGVPFEDFAGIQDAGLVQVLAGGPSRLSATQSQVWHQDVPGVEGIAETEDYFGYTLAAGDFRGDGCFDLAIGAPWEDVNGAEDAGAVNVLYGTPAGLSSANDLILHQDVANVWEICETRDYFGIILAAGRTNGDAHWDLAVGVPLEGDPNYQTGASGGVHVFFGSATGLQTPAPGEPLFGQLLSQASPGVIGEPEDSDEFGASLACADFNADGFSDLAIGVPGETMDLLEWAGAVVILPGGSTGPSGANDQLWTQNSSGIADSMEEGDWFGSSLGQ